MDMIRCIIANRVPQNEPLFHSSQNLTPGLSQQAETSIQSSQYFPQRLQQLQQTRLPYNRSDTQNFEFVTPSTTKHVPPRSQASTLSNESPSQSIRSMIVETPKYVARRIRLAFGLEPIKAVNGLSTESNAQENSTQPVENKSENKPVDYEIKASLDIMGRNVASLRNELQNRTAAAEVQVESVPFSKYVQMSFGKVFKLHTHHFTKFAESNSQVKDALLLLCKTTESFGQESRAMQKSLEALEADVMHMRQTTAKILLKMNRKKALQLKRKICGGPQFSQFRKVKRLKPKSKKANCPRIIRPHLSIPCTQLSPEISRMVPVSTASASSEVPRVVPAISNTEVNPRMVPASPTSISPEVPRVMPAMANTEVNPRMVPASTTSVSSEVSQVVPAISNTEFDPYNRAAKQIAKRRLSGMVRTLPASKKCKAGTQDAEIDDEFSIIYESVSSVPPFGSLIRITRNWLSNKIGLIQPTTSSTQTKEKILNGKKTTPQVLTELQHQLSADERQNQSVQINSEPVVKPGPDQPATKKTRGRSKKATSKENVALGK